MSTETVTVTPACEHALEKIGETTGYGRTSQNGYDIMYCPKCGAYLRYGPTYFGCGVRGRSIAQTETLQREATERQRVMIAEHKSAVLCAEDWSTRRAYYSPDEAAHAATRTRSATKKLGGEEAGR